MGITVDLDRLHGLLVNAVRDHAIYGIDLDGRVSSWNPGAARITGYAADEVMDREFALFFTPEDQAAGKPSDLMDQARTEGQAAEEGWRVRKDGSRFWALSTLHALHDTDGSFIGYAKITHDLTERRRREESLAASERQFRLLMSGVTNSAIYMLSPDGLITTWNMGAERIKGYRAEEALGRHFRMFYTEIDQERGAPEATLARASTEGRYETEAWRVRKDGETFWAHIVVEAIHDEGGELLGFAKITRDVTDRQRTDEQLKEAQSRLAQSQRLEAIGKLTGGIAHDFNNQLQVILSNLEFLAEHTAQDGEAARRVANAAQAAEHSAALTRRLLAFARRQPLSPKVVNLSSVIQGMADLLRQTLGERIDIESVVSGGLWNTVVDTIELENALLNLAVNARDAMPDGGRLTIEIGNAHLDHDYTLSHDIAMGQYVVVAVTDTGGGMTAEQVEKAFEPFYTTKEDGRGTGLGLSQVHGFIKQSGGHIKLYSEPGKGTTVKMYLPRSKRPEAAAPTPVTAQLAGRGECVLIVEDDPAVRRAAVEMVSELGYRPLQASDSESALAILRSGAAVDLLFTDIVMPGPLNGRDLSRSARELMPGIGVLFTSGYTENAIIHNGQLDEGVLLLSKPYGRRDLAVKLRMAIGEAAKQEGSEASPPVAETALPRILFVEDEPLLRASIGRLLERLGYVVVPAGSGEEALREAEEEAFDLLLTDLAMPDMNGVELIRSLRQKHPGMPAILVTGRPPDAPLPDGVILLDKPFSRERLARVLAEAGCPPPAR